MGRGIEAEEEVAVCLCLGTRGMESLHPKGGGLLQSLSSSSDNLVPCGGGGKGEGEGEDERGGRRMERLSMGGRIKALHIRELKKYFNFGAHFLCPRKDGFRLLGNAAKVSPRMAVREKTIQYL